MVTQYQPQRVRHAVNEATAAQMVKALKTVVSAEGTAQKAALTNYAVAGKTGTRKSRARGLSARQIYRFVHRFLPGGQSRDLHFIVLDEPDLKQRLLWRKPWRRRYFTM